jgi:hypothetical protein
MRTLSVLLILTAIAANQPTHRLGTALATLAHCLGG